MKRSPGADDPEAGAAPWPRTLWLTGLSGAGKSTLALALRRRLAAEGRPAYILDGDQLRLGLNRDLGFSPADRAENIRRTAEVARLMNQAGLVVIAALISPYRRDREAARGIIGPEAFLEVYLSTPLAVCEVRDPKGMYRRARSGELPAFTGISAPYEPPERPDLALDTSRLDPAPCVAALLQLLRAPAAPPQRTGADDRGAARPAGRG
jgi:adenylyl-sulfate kinase